MRFTMTTMEEKKRPTVEDSEQTQSAPTPGKKSLKKFIIVGVVGVVVVALVLASILIGIYFFTEDNLRQYEFQLDKDTKQTMSVDPDNNVVVYHVTNKDVNADVVDDFNRFIRVTRQTSASGSNCFVHPLNESSPVDSESVDAPSGQPNMNNASTLYYVSSRTPIVDTTFLSKKAQSICSGVPVYWAYPMCSDPNVPPRLQKRGACSWICNWIWNGSSYQQYCYLADWLCTVISWFW